MYKYKRQCALNNVLFISKSKYFCIPFDNVNIILIQIPKRFVNKTLVYLVVVFSLATTMANYSFYNTLVTENTFQKKKL